MAAEDISAELAAEAAEATGGGGKPYIRHGKYYELLITRVHSKKVKKDDRRWDRYAFMEFRVLKAVPHEKGAIPVSLQNKDDGTTPNAVGTACSNSVNYDHPTAGMMAAQNVREFEAGFFGVNVDELSKDDAFRTWIDLCRKEDVKAGGVDYIDPKTKQPVIATKDKVANMGCGYIIGLSTSSKENKSTRKLKELEPEKREYFTQKNWVCIARPGTPGSINSPELVAKRRAEIYLNAPPVDDDDGDDGEVDMASVGGAVPPAGAAPQAPASSPTPPTAPQPPSGSPTPPTAPANWPPVSPWEAQSPATAAWLTAGFVWSNPNNGGTNSVISEADYKAGKR